MLEVSAPSSAPTLVRTPVRPALRPRWDEAGERVLAHRAGALRVLGGPGTGKSTLLVHAVLRRLADGVDPEQILVLVGSRRAAVTLREQITAGLAAADGAPRTVREPLVRTVHSYAFGLLRLHAARHATPPPRLLAGPEQDVVVRELLAGELAGEVTGAGWPARLLACLPMPGFAAELRELLLRAAERGLGPAELQALGERDGFPEWVAAGRFFRRYEEVTLLRGSAGQGAPQATAPALDAAELVAAALDALADDEELLAGERDRVRHLLVDDAQDLDPQQAELVATVGTTAETYLLAGDPDQAVLTFRGADPDALDSIGQSALLTLDHRSTPELRLATGRLAARMAGASPARVRVGPAQHDGTAAGGVAVRVFASAAQEARWVADQLRRAHLMDGVAWSDMAVLVRSTARTMPVLRRALLGAGVPMTVPADQLPVARQPGVLPLLLLLRCDAQPATLDADACVALLTSALGGAEPLTLRRLRRGLLKLAAAGGDGAADMGSDELLVAALRDAAAGALDPLTPLPSRDTDALRRVGGLISSAAEATASGHTVEQVLWQVWQASGLAGRWAAASARGGPIGAQADRDLDAVLALFDAAGRYTDRLPGADVAGFAGYLADQQIPGDTLASRAVQGDAVAVLTAHAARGREWRVVAVPAVQEGSWPDLRLRGTLLGVERLVDTVAGLSAGQHASLSAPLLAEERRLFYLACTRAKQTLLVSAVRGQDEQPSRFLDELDPDAADPAQDGPRPMTQPPRALLLAELVGELRRAVCSGDASGAGGAGALADAPAERRERAAAQLALLAEAGIPGAHPDEWYGLAEVSSDGPLRDPDQPVPLSPSAVETIIKCPLRWALQRHGGDDGATLPSVTGSLVHALVQACADGAPDAEVEQALRAAWATVDAGAPWFGRHELERVRGMLAAFRQWLAASRAAGLSAVAVERRMELLLPADERNPAVLVRGQVDRLDVDANGRAVIVDVKTGKTAVTKDAAL
ncbi:MAG: UvrD/REP helicase, partial [Pseudonocardia sp.]|nr:UvrD/REP helicase [Pseudonocardia sp.]